MPSDCELITSGLLAQPANALSSLAFIVAAVAIGRRHLVGAVALAAAGVGSFLGHGGVSSIPGLAHDVGLAALVAVVAFELWRLRRDLPWIWIATLAAGAGIWALSRTGGPLCAESTWFQGHAAWHVLAAVGTAGILVAALSARATRPALRSQPTDGPRGAAPRRSR